MAKLRKIRIHKSGNDIHEILSILDDDDYLHQIDVGRYIGDDMDAVFENLIDVLKGFRAMHNLREREEVKS